MMPENLSDEIRILDECGGDNLDSSIDSSLRKLLDETKDFIHRYLEKTYLYFENNFTDINVKNFFSYKSRDLATVLSACLNSAFNLLNQDVLPNFFSEDELSEGKIEKNITLVKLLPFITKEAHVVLNGAPPRFLEVCKLLVCYLIKL